MVQQREHQTNCQGYSSLTPSRVEHSMCSTQNKVLSRVELNMLYTDLIFRVKLEIIHLSVDSTN